MHPEVVVTQVALGASDQTRRKFEVYIDERQMRTNQVEPPSLAADNGLGGVPDEARKVEVRVLVDKGVVPVLNMALSNHGRPRLYLASAAAWRGSRNASTEYPTVA
jgi:hypothetical protein